jgi:AcrR family transcriptional regulator
MFYHDILSESMGVEKDTDRAAVAGGEAVPEPPWVRKRRPARRAPLTREAIVGAALAVLDRDGLEAMSMRRVAEELGTGAASLYWHFGNKDELLDSVFDRVIGEIGLPAPDPARWQEQVKEVAREARVVMKAHRDIYKVSLGRYPVGPNALAYAEGMLAILRSGGVSGRASAYATHLLTVYVGAYALEEGAEPRMPGEGVDPGESLDMIRGYFASLPAGRFPNVVALAEDLTADDPDDEFETGLGLIVGGLAAQTARTPRFT